MFASSNLTPSLNWTIRLDLLMCSTVSSECMSKALHLPFDIYFLILRVHGGVFDQWNCSLQPLLCYNPSPWNLARLLGCNLKSVILLEQLSDGGLTGSSQHLSKSRKIPFWGSWMLCWKEMMMPDGGSPSSLVQSFFSSRCRGEIPIRILASHFSNLTTVALFKATYRPGNFNIFCVFIP